MRAQSPFHPRCGGIYVSSPRRRFFIIVLLATLLVVTVMVNPVGANMPAPLPVGRSASPPITGVISPPSVSVPLPTGRPTSAANATRSPTAMPTSIPPGAQRGVLTFNDEFDGTHVDTTKWATQCDGATPQALSYCGGTDQYYSPSALSVSSGTLHITASPHRLYDHAYTSGIVWTNGKFGQTYGYWEMRARMPRGVGMWPAFWGIPNNTGGPPELDVMEMYMGTSTSAVDYNIHWRGCAPTNECDNEYQTHPAGDLTQGYHVFAMDWRADHVSWYVDGILQWKQTAAQATIPSVPFCVMVQLAVGSDWNNQHGVGETATMDVDYVRIFA
jgi:beta-glucanase (GH16 family)